MDRHKELKELYKQMKPDMGIFIIRSKTNNKYHLQGTQNLNGVINGTLFRLNGGGHPNKELQKEWIEHGEDNFVIETLEILDYDKDESKTDYTEDLAIMCMVWEEKFAKENLVVYRKRL